MYILELKFLSDFILAETRSTCERIKILGDDLKTTGFDRPK